MPRYFITQTQFDTWASTARRWHLYGLGAVMVLLAVAYIAAVVIMGPRLVR